MCADFSGGTWLPPSPSLRLLSPPYHVEERENKGEGSRAAMQSSHAERSRAGSEMTITNLAVRWHALCCWMLLQSTRSTTLVHLLPPRRPLHLHLLHSISLPSLPHDASHRTEEGECTTMEQSQYACHGSKRRWCGVRWERMQQKRRGSTTSHLLTHVPLVACVCMCGMQVEEDLSCW